MKNKFLYILTILALEMLISPNIISMLTPTTSDNVEHSSSMDIETAGESAQETIVHLPDYIDAQLASLTKDNKLTCCNKAFTRWHTLHEHFKYFHKLKDERSYRACPVCKKKHGKIDNALSCFVRHTDKTFFWCPKCNTSLNLYQHLRDHCSYSCPKKHLIKSCSLNQKENNNADDKEYASDDESLILKDRVSIIINRRIQTLKLTCCQERINTLN